MTELINNTLEILCRLSKSDYGYILKLNSHSKDVLNSFGEVREISEIMNNILTLHFFPENTENYNLKNSANVNILGQKYNINSFLVKRIYVNAALEENVYIILLSANYENYKSSVEYAIKPVMEIITRQVKSFLEQENVTGHELIKKKNFRKQILNNGSNLFNIILDVSEDLIFILDSEGKFIALNEFGAASLDYDSEEMAGRHFLEFVPLKEKSTASAAFQKLIENKKIVTFETTFISKFGKVLIFEISGRTIFDNGIVNGVLAIGKNITGLRTFEEKISQLNTKLMEANRIINIEKQRSARQKSILFELNKMKSEFLSNISHELRTPLASIIGFSETIASDPEMPPEMKNEFNNIILNEGKRLAKLINDVLDVSRIESGEIELNKADSDIINILKEAIDNNIKGINEKNLTVSTEIPDENVILKVDKERILQVLNCVINNAVKFNIQNGRIAVHFHEFYKEIEIAISDTGIGIPEKDLPYIFQKFYRVNRPGVELPGAGLGLVFTKQIVDLHKGFILIQSEINKGTTVIIKLPKTSKL